MHSAAKARAMAAATGKHPGLDHFQSGTYTWRTSGWLKHVYFCKVWGAPGPPSEPPPSEPPSPGPESTPKGRERSPGHPEQFPHRHKMKNDQ